MRRIVYSAEASRGWVMNNTSAKWSVAETICTWVSNWSGMVKALFFFALWLAQKTSATPSINNQKLKPNRDLVARVLPCLKLFACYYFGYLLTLVIFRCIFVGCWDCKSFWFECALWWAFTSEIKMYVRYLLFFRRVQNLKLMFRQVFCHLLF